MSTDARWIARLAKTAFVLVLAIVASSAFIRLSAGVADASQAALEIARIAHRISASVAGLLVLLAAGLVLTRDSSRWPDIALAGAALFVMLALAWVGRYSGPNATAAVLFCNLAGGLALSTLLWAVAARASTPGDAVPLGELAMLAPLALLGIGLQCVTGAMTVTGFAKVGAAHHLSGIVAFGLCAWLAIRLGRSPSTKSVGRLIIALAGFQASLGIAAWAFALPLWLVLSHNIGAALLLAALAHVLSPARPPNAGMLPIP